MGRARTYKNAYPCLSRRGYIYTCVEKLPAFIQFKSIKATTLGRKNSHHIKMIPSASQINYSSFTVSEVTFHFTMLRSRYLGPNRVQWFLYKGLQNNILSKRQWWILGEANEAVASAPSLENSTYSFFSLQMFFRDYYEVGTKSGKYKIDSR